MAIPASMTITNRFLEPICLVVCAGRLFVVKQSNQAHDKLFANHPPAIRNLAKQAQRETREKQRKDWWTKQDPKLKVQAP